MPLSSAPLCFDISGLGVRFRGLPAALQARMRHEWSGFVCAEGGPVFLDFACTVLPEGPDDSAFSARALTAAFSNGAARYAMKEAIVDVPPDGPLSLRIESTTAERQFLALANLLCAAFAWRLPARGGAMLHAAGIVVDERAFVLVGPEGSGKTTWALLAKSTGAVVVSDDVVALEPSAEGRYEVLGTPFRSRQHGTARPVRWPLAAILLPEHGEAAALRPASALAVRALLMANLPFVAEAAAHDERPHRLLELLATAAPARILTFSIDPGFVPLLAAFEP